MIAKRRTVKWMHVAYRVWRVFIRILFSFWSDMKWPIAWFSMRIRTLTTFFRLMGRHPDRYCTARNHQFDSWQSGAYFIFSVMHLTRALNGLGTAEGREQIKRVPLVSIIAIFHSKATKLSFYPLRSLGAPFTWFKNLIRWLNSKQYFLQRSRFVKTSLL